jgi:glycine oxidase
MSESTVDATTVDAMTVDATTVDVGTVDVVIAGGGLIGLGIAWRCAQRGLSVTVVDPDAGRGASQAAAGMLAPVAEASYGEERLLRLCQDSLARYPAFVAELQAAVGDPNRDPIGDKGTVGLRTNGTLQVGFDADDMRALDELHRFHQELGLPAQRLTAGDARRLEPGLTPRIRGAVHVPGDHSVDGRALHRTLWTAAEKAGVTVDRRRATAVAVEAGRAVGLVLDDGGMLRGTTTVNALGAWSQQLAGGPAVPVRPVGGQILRLRGEPQLDGTLRALVRGRSVYLVPLGADELIVGATVEEKGFDSRVTAGGVYELLRDAIEVVPGVAELELAETLVRYRPGTPDNAPILGACELPGLVLATGHYRNGVLLTPVTADAIAELVARGSLPDVAEGFGLDRFLLRQGSRA